MTTQVTVEIYRLVLFETRLYVPNDTN